MRGVNGSIEMCGYVVTADSVLYREYFVKLFWRKGPTSESVVELNETNNRTLADFERYLLIEHDIMYLHVHVYRPNVILFMYIMCFSYYHSVLGKRP